MRMSESATMATGRLPTTTTWPAPSATQEPMQNRAKLPATVPVMTRLPLGSLSTGGEAPLSIVYMPPAIVTVAALFCTPLQVMPFDGVIAQWSGTPSAASAGMQLQPGVQPPPAMSTPPATVNLPKLSIAEQLANAASKTRLEIARNGKPSNRRSDDRNDAGTLRRV